MTGARDEALRLHRAGRLHEAIAVYASLIEASPADARLRRLIGTALSQAGDVDRAIEQLDAAIGLDPDDAVAFLNLGNCHQSRGDFERAIACYARAVEIRPGYAQAAFNQGIALRSCERLEDALACFDATIAVEPEHAGAHHNRANTLRDLGRPEASLDAYARALSLRPGHAETHNNRGNALKRLGRLDEALDSYERAIERAPRHAGAHYNRGKVLRDLGRPEDALESYDRAIALQPDFAEAYWNKSHLLLALGRFEPGWRLYEWRMRTPGIDGRYAKHRWPDWRGEVSIEGRTLLIYSEQGLGDVVQFCRYLPLLRRFGANLVFEVPAVLKPLIETLDAPMTLRSRDDTLPRIDACCPLMSLPLVLGTTVDTIPSMPGYLSVPAESAARWRTRLGERTRCRVGLVWSGSEKHHNDAQRSARLADLEDLLAVDVEWHALQKEFRESDLPRLQQAAGLRRHDAELAHFGDTAALIDAMDLVVTVDTSVAHVAGALGKPVWILLPWAAEYRWMIDRADSPWYPSATLFRQSARGDWAGLSSIVAGALRRRLAA